LRNRLGEPRLINEPAIALLQRFAIAGLQIHVLGQEKVSRIYTMNGHHEIFHIVAVKLADARPHDGG